jgi:site-specific DNA-methyltransferase (adenine-specific)
MNSFQTNRIIHGEAAAQLSQMPNQCIDLIITDPPYLVGYRDRFGRTVANDQNPDGVLPAFPEMARVLRDNRYMILFCGWRAIDQFSAAWTQAGLRAVGQIFWSKNYTSSTWHTECRHESAWLLAKGFPAKPADPISDVQEWSYTGNRAHPTEKSVDILAPLVRAYSKPGDVVLDPFSGSGSTSVAAALNGRRYIEIELEESYCQYARHRLAGAVRYRQKKAA